MLIHSRLNFTSWINTWLRRTTFLVIHTMPHRFIVNDTSKILLREGIDISVIYGAVKQKRGRGIF